MTMGIEATAKIASLSMPSINRLVGREVNVCGTVLVPAQGFLFKDEPIRKASASP
jgi:hypothetical protein